MGSTARSRLRSATAASARFGVAASCLTLVTSITATVVVVPRPAAADEVSSLKAEAAEVAEQLIQEQLQVGAYEQQYALASQKLQHDADEIAQTEQQIAVDEQNVERDRTLLRRQALFDYTNSEADLGDMQQFFDGDQDTLAVQTEYEHLASAQVQNSVDQLHVSESSLRSVEATLQRQEALDQTTTSAAAALEQQADQTQDQLQSLQASINGQLAAAVAQQQAEQAVAAAAALRAAQQASAARAELAPTSGSQPGSDPALPPFLQCVLQAESGGNYGAVSPGGTYMGGFQFSQATWNEAAMLAGIPGLVGVPPDQASPAQQDALAVALYSADGEQPWYDPCRSSG